MTQTALDMKPATAPDKVIPPTPDTTAEKNDAAAHFSLAERFKVIDADTYEAAFELIKRGRVAIATIETKLGPIRDAAHKAHKGACALITELTSPFTKGETLLADKAKAWKRIEDEKQRKAEEEARAKAAKEAEEAKLAEAIEVEQEYGKEAADAILDAPAPVVATHAVRSFVPKVAGVATPKTYRAEIVNLDLIERKHLVATENQIEALQSYLNAMARAAKKAFNIPGARLIEEDGTRVRV